MNMANKKVVGWGFFEKKKGGRVSSKIIQQLNNLPALPPSETVS